MPPKPKSKVGQTVSNANRSYYRTLASAKENCEKYHEIGDVLGHSLHMAVVYTTKDGFVKYVGSKNLIRTISEKCEKELLEASFWDKEDQNHDTTDRTNLPPLPRPCSQLDSKSLQSIIPKVMRGVNGGGYIKWDSPSNKPVWWPEGVTFGNVKQRPVDQDPAVPWVDCLRKILRALYSHYGQDAETFIEDSIPNTSGEQQQDQQEVENIEPAEITGNVSNISRQQNVEDCEDFAQSSTNNVAVDLEKNVATIEGNEDPVDYTFNEDSLRTSTPRKSQNWREDEDDPCVRDYIQGYLSPNANKKRIRGPPRCFTPSDWK